VQLGRVIGDVVATRKDPRFAGIALLIVQPIAADGSNAGRALVAVDAIGAGVGEHVFFVRGKEASFPFHPVDVPADAGIVGIVDHWTADGVPVAAPGPVTAAPARRPRSPGRAQGSLPAEGV
jgi:microcompartment protein CcmK/EutM